MLASVFQNLMRPSLFLLASFVAGLLLDALAERAGGQETNAFLIQSPTQDLPPTQDNAGVSTTPPVPSAEGLFQDAQGVQIPDLEDLGKPIMDIRVFVKVASTIKPEDRSPDLFSRFGNSNYPNSFQHRLAMWRAPDIRYQPLYYEHVALERYGQDHGLVQPFVSALHFAGSQTFLLYNLCVDRPHSCTYPLGFCRPGSLAPLTHTRWLWHPHDKK